MTRVGSIRADVTRRLLTFSATLALFAAACGAPVITPVDFGGGARFVPSVVDTLDQVGQGSSLAIGSDGTVYASYFGYPGAVAEGQIQIPRPIGAAFLPAVLLSSVTADGLITKGAVQQLKPAVEPPGIRVPFRPATVAGLDLTLENANGSSVVVAADGSVHVAWTAGGAVYYAKVVTGSDAAVSAVYQYDGTITRAGPLGRPAITLDGSGSPWIAFGVNDAGGLREVVATPDGDEWNVTDVASLTACNGCPQPLPSGIAVVSGAPVVVFGDPGADALLAATPDGKSWALSTIETGARGDGLSFAAAGDIARAAFYTGAGAVHVATWDGSSWSTAEVAPAPDATATSGLAAPTTGVAIAGDGSVWVAWEDRGVHLASGDGTSFSRIETPGTDGGTGPSVAVDGDGNVHLAWYATGSKDLMIGIWGDPGEVLLAEPSPAPTASLAPAADTSCGADKKIVLDIVALNTQFDPTCLVAAAGEPFTVSYDNQDAAIPHNFEIYTEQGGAKIAGTELVAGPLKDPLDVDPLDEGSYYFQCLAHPTQMFGTLSVVKGAK